MELENSGSRITSPDFDQLIKSKDQNNVTFDPTKLCANAQDSSQKVTMADVSFASLIIPTEPRVMAEFDMSNLINAPENSSQPVKFETSLIRDSEPDIRCHLEVASVQKDPPKPKTEKNNQSQKAQPNNNQVRSSGKKVHNWFTKMVERRGEEYFSANRVTVDDVSRNAERILNDIVSGYIDYNVQGKYLLNHTVLETLISYCSNKLAIYKTIHWCVGYTYNSYVHKDDSMAYRGQINAISSIDESVAQNIPQAITILNQDIGMYELLYNKLSSVKATQNISYLFSIASDMRDYLAISRKRY